MSPESLALLQKNIDKVVRLKCTDGEVIVAEIAFVDPQEKEIVYNVLSTTNESRYEKFPRPSAFLMRFEEISSVEEVPDVG